MTNFHDQYGRISIGFDNLFSDFDRLTNITSQYPPHNIVKLSDHSFQMEFAVAGFSDDEIEIKQEDGHLYISGSKNTEAVEKEYIHHGISSRDFRNKFRLAEYVEVADAKLSSGLLVITLEQNLPESKKPKLISISSD